MLSVRCAGIVYDGDGVWLVRKKGAQKWGLPERVLTEVENAELCIRRCVLLQTGYKAAHISLYKIQSEAKTNKNGALLRFVFGCRAAQVPLQPPDGEFEAAHFRPEAIVKVADKGQFNDSVLLQLVHDYYFNLGRPSKNSDPLQA